MSVAGKPRLATLEREPAAAADLQRFVNAGRLAAGTAQEALSALGLAQDDVAFLCQLLEEGSARASGREIEDAAAHARRAVSQAVARMAAMLSLARPRPAELARLDVREVIGAALFDLESRLSAYSVAVDMDKVPPALAERGGLLQSVASLLLDAADNSPQRGRIVVALRFVEGEIAIAIDDEGPAPLSPETLADREGTSLWICRGVVRSFGGELSVSQGVLGGRHVVVRLRPDRP